MASLTRGPPPLLRPNRAQSGLNVHTSHTQGQGLGQGQGQGGNSQRPVPRDTEILPFHAPKNRVVGDTPLNTPAQPIIAIAPRLAAVAGTAGGGGGGGVLGGGGGGRPIGRVGVAPHAATPGNTPSSLETMGRRIASKLQGNKGPAGGVGSPGPLVGSGDTRIAPSYERRFTAGLSDLSHRLATHQEKPVPVDSPSSSMQRLQLVSPASTDQGKKGDWPTSYDTDTNDGESGQVEQAGQEIMRAD